MNMKIDLRRAIRFVHDREHDEGGFTLYRGIPDTKNTYFGIKTLQLFNSEPYNKEKTIKWIRKLQKDRMFGIRGVFYRFNILKMYNQKIHVTPDYPQRLEIKNYFSSIEIAYYHSYLSKILKLDNLNKISDFILSHQNKDYGFGLERSDIISTYYALESLNDINPSLIRGRNRILEFTHNCLNKEGGYTFIPDIYPPYLEPTYAGIRINEILNNRPPNLDKTLDFIRKLQNSNGGFRRSQYMGISELEYTYRALYILKRYDNLKC